MHCRRTETGEASADHLYIGQALRRWLLRQGYEVTYLDPARSTAEPPRSGSVRAGPGSSDYCGLSHNEVNAAGHAIRISCRTEGDTREVHVGTQYPDNSLAWSAITECRLSNEGIITPRLDAEPPANSTPAPTPTPVTFPLAPGTIAYTAATELPAPQPDPDGTAVRLYSVETASACSLATSSTPRAGRTDAVGQSPVRTAHRATTRFPTAAVPGYRRPPVPAVSRGRGFPHPARAAGNV